MRDLQRSLTQCRKAANKLRKLQELRTTRDRQWPEGTEVYFSRATKTVLPRCCGLGQGAGGCFASQPGSCVAGAGHGQQPWREGGGANAGGRLLPRGGRCLGVSGRHANVACWSSHTGRDACTGAPGGSRPHLQCAGGQPACQEASAHYCHAKARHIARHATHGTASDMSGAGSETSRCSSCAIPCHVASAPCRHPVRQSSAGRGGSIHAEPSASTLGAGAAQHFAPAAFCEQAQAEDLCQRSLQVSQADRQFGGVALAAGRIGEAVKAAREARSASGGSACPVGCGCSGACPHRKASRGPYYTPGRRRRGCCLDMQAPSCPELGRME